MYMTKTPANLKTELKILKFRSFVSKEEEGFVVIFDHEIPEIIFEDLLFQLFEPIFEDLPCPDIYYFSSTDQTLQFSEMISKRDYVYVHFLQRVEQYEKLEKLTNKLKIGNLEKLSKGVTFKGVNMYVISEKYYLMYGHDLFYDNIEKKVNNLPREIERKSIKYEESFKSLTSLKDNHHFHYIKKELEEQTKNVEQKLKNLEAIVNRYSKARNTLVEILKESGIKINGIKDLY